MVTIENVSGRLVSLRLNSGTILHLPPSTSSPELVDEEVHDNAEVQKLLDRRVIARYTAAAVKDETVANERSVARPHRKQAGEHREGEQ